MLKSGSMEADSIEESPEGNKKNIKKKINM